MRDKSKKIGINNVMRIAEKKIYDLAEKNLSSDRFLELQSAFRKGAFVGGFFPSPDWKNLVNFTPDNEYFYEVFVGIAVERGKTPNIFARALISRDGEEDYCHIIWEPKNFP